MDDTTHLFFATRFIVWGTSVAVAVPNTISRREIIGLESSGWEQIKHNEARQIPLPEQLLILDPEWRKAGLFNWIKPLAAAALRRVRHFEICNDFPHGAVVHFLRRYFSYYSPKTKTTYVIGLPGDTEEYVISRIKNSGWNEIGVAKVLTVTNAYRPNGKSSMLARATMENELPLKQRAAIRGMTYDICTPKTIREQGVVIGREEARHSSSRASKGE